MAAERKKRPQGSRRWTRDELLAALSLYCRIPFGQLHATQPDIRRMAARMGRTPASVSMKLCNFASLDPTLQARGIRGLQGASSLDRDVWAEFHSRWDELAEAVAPEEEAAPSLVHPAGGLAFPTMPAPGTPTEAVASVKVRKGQAFFRQAVLAAYQGRCCVTEIAEPVLLRASHIQPWADNPARRLDPSNGLCLNALHDAAFDAGLVTFDERRRLLLSSSLTRAVPGAVHRTWFAAFAGKPLSDAEKFPPDESLLAWHRRERFCA
jgi:hypothetical protein